MPVGTINFLRHDFDNGDAVFLSPAAPLPETSSGGPQETGRAAELFGQLFEEAVKPVLTDRLPDAGLLREKYLHKVRRRGAHEALRACARPGQLSSRVCVFTVSACSPKRFK